MRIRLQLDLRPAGKVKKSSTAKWEQTHYEMLEVFDFPGRVDDLFHEFLRWLVEQKDKQEITRREEAGP